MGMRDEQFIKEKVNPVVGFIFHTARQLGADNAPDSMDMKYLRQGTERVLALIEDARLAAAERSPWVPITEPRTVAIPHKTTLLLTYEKFGAYMVTPAWFNEHRNQWFWGDKGEQPIDPNEYRLVAWMRLPKPCVHQASGAAGDREGGEGS